MNYYDDKINYNDNHNYHNNYDNNTYNFSDNITDVYFINFTFLFFITIVCTSILCPGNNNRRNNMNQRLLNSPTYNPNDIEKKEIKYNNEIHNDRECTICLEEYEENNELYQLQCGHYYHKECIDDWLLKHQTCPLCRLNLV